MMVSALACVAFCSGSAVATTETHGTVSTLRCTCSCWTVNCFGPACSEALECLRGLKLQGSRSIVGLNSVKYGWWIPHLSGSKVGPLKSRSCRDSTRRQKLGTAKCRRVSAVPAGNNMITATSDAPDDVGCAGGLCLCSTPAGSSPQYTSLFASQRFQCVSSLRSVHHNGASQTALEALAADSCELCPKSFSRRLRMPFIPSCIASDVAAVEEQLQIPLWSRA